MTFEVKSVSDRNFLKLGIVLILAGIVFSAILYFINAPWWIAFRAGLGLGVFIVVVHYVAVFMKAQKDKRTGDKS